jgi:hypothetical protein
MWVEPEVTFRIFECAANLIKILMLRARWSYAPYSLFELWFCKTKHQSLIQFKPKDTNSEVKVKLCLALRLTTLTRKSLIILMLKLTLHIELIRGLCLERVPFYVVRFVPGGKFSCDFYIPGGFRPQRIWTLDPRLYCQIRSWE